MSKSIILVIAVMLLMCSRSASQNAGDVELVRLATIKADSTATVVKKVRPYTSLTSSKRMLARYNPVTLLFSSLMYLYQNVVSSQVNARCLYAPSCSEFSKGCIKQHGLLKGVLLTADRLQRCNRITAMEFTQHDFDSTYHVHDHPGFYE